MNYMILNNIKKIILIGFIMTFCSGISSSALTVWDNPRDIKVYVPQVDDRTKLMKKAFEEWQQKTQNRFVFKFVNSVEDADIDVVFIEKNLESYCGKPDALGCSYPSVRDGMPKETIYMAKRSPKGLLLSNSQVYVIMKHEIGHSIGLEHSQDIHGIMYPLTNLHISLRQDIRDSDLNNLYDLYGINPQKQR